MSEQSATILLVDDSEPNRYAMARALRQAGFEVTEAATGCAAKATLAAPARQPDIAVIDVKLPDISGFELCRQLKSNLETASMPVLQISATFTSDEYRVQGLEGGADGYLTQPCEAPVLTATIRALLRVKQAEERAGMLSRQWQITFDSISDGIWLLDPDGFIVRSNAAMKTLLGKLDDMGRRATTNHHFMDFLRQAGMPPGHVPDASPAYWVGRKPEIRINGRWFRISTDRMLDERGRLAEWVQVFSDVTQQRDAEDERALLLAREQETCARLEEASHIKDDFLATLSHELRTPMSAILGWTKLLATDKIEPERMAAALQSIERNTLAQLQIVNDLLDVSRVIAGKMRLDLQPMDLVPTVASAVETMRPMADAKRQHLSIALGMERAPINGDVTRIQQILGNLLGNAIKFTPADGCIEVAVESAGANVEVRVRDNGSGIDAAFLPFVFDRFRQGDSTTTRRHSGLGLGLSIVRHFTEMHGGTARAQSLGLAQGATFTVSLPLINGAEPGARAGGEPECRARPLAGVRILIADDDAESSALIGMILRSRGAEVSQCASSFAALQTVGAYRPDLLVNDIKLPNQDGYALIRKVRALPATAGGRIPALALTAYAGQADRERVLAAGFDAYETKPVNPKGLVDTILKLLGRAGGSPP